jgi:hypothetical protein
MKNFGFASRKTEMVDQIFKPTMKNFMSSTIYKTIATGPAYATTANRGRTAYYVKPRGPATVPLVTIAGRPCSDQRMSAAASH